MVQIERSIEDAERSRNKLQLCDVLTARVIVECKGEKRAYTPFSTGFSCEAMGLLSTWCY